MSIEEKLEKIREEIDYANCCLDDIKELLGTPDKVKDFLLEIAIDEKISEDIQKRANELWKEVY